MITELLAAALIATPSPVPTPIAEFYLICDAVKATTGPYWRSIGTWDQDGKPLCENINSVWREVKRCPEPISPQPNEPKLVNCKRLEEKKGK